MKLLQGAVAILFYNACYTSFAAVGMVMATERLYGRLGQVAESSSLYLLVFAAVLVVYNGSYLFKTSSMPAWAPLLFRQGKSMYVVALIAGIGVFVAAALSAPTSALLLSAPIGVVALLYSAPWLPLRSINRLRDNGVVKTISLAGSWTVVTALLPLLSSQLPASTVFLCCAGRFAFIFAICIVFDKRDLEKDAATGTNTIPLMVGHIKTRLIIAVSLALFVVASLLECLVLSSVVPLVAAAAASTLLWLFVSYLQRACSYLLYIVLGDGSLLVYSATVLLWPI